MSKDTTGNTFDVGLFRRLMRYTKPYRLTFLGVALAAIMLSVFSSVRPILLKYTVDDYILNKDAHGLLMFVVYMTAVLFLEVISQLSFIYYANWLGQSVIEDIRVKLFKHMLRFRMKYFDNSSVGILVTRAVSDIERIAAIFSDGLFMIVSDLLKMIVVAGVMIYFDWQLSLIVFAILPLMLYATRLFQKAMKKAFIEVRKEVSNLNSFVQERLTGMKIVQLFVREKEEYNQFKVINNKHKKAWINTVWYNSIFIAVVELMSAVTTGLIVWYGGLRAVTDGAEDLGNIFMFIMLSSMIFRPLRQIADKFNTLQMGMVAANRVFDILDTDSKIDNDGTVIAKNLKGDIVFKDVRFGYLEDEEVLHGISFEAKPGETIAIVGATGAGKSTIINLLNRFYDINSGAILADGVNINDFTLESLRSQIAVVLQDVFLFADTILNNITLNDPSIKEEDVIQAAKDIGIHKFIKSLPGGYHYNVKERGSMLSSGQRQLIAFLRAYVSDPSILVLDEATSSVDTHSEILIQKATDKITKGRTSIVIAHRLATIKKANRILVMEAGKIVESGTHTELLKKADGYYRNLYEVQFMAEEAV
ncbi:ABC transporter ATP-binding protein [Galbibacter pacificus]|uniref:ABC transporter ATP-binding protein n=1 Tax=Galbibacter pacificus TaxID=2996052 RepID=A0ABT6FW47_9FLAO|nr:ABC transporter ATP-binding protein [Galbibacter pacificus]MDG3583765.1 ABC transporter ATP-binding protein [Galbibacter pacificus]MDG3587317.1 ABC transporter ATP-binding protein [Galbibacter pacificus]